MSNFDDFYDRLMGEEMKNGETLNEFAESMFTLEERERMFGYLHIDRNDDLWVVDLDDKDIRIKVESMDDFYAFLAKQKLGGDAQHG